MSSPAAHVEQSQVCSPDLVRPAQPSPQPSLALAFPSQRHLNVAADLAQRSEERVAEGADTQ